MRKRMLSCALLLLLVWGISLPVLAGGSITEMIVRVVKGLNSDEVKLHTDYTYISPKAGSGYPHTDFNVTLKQTGMPKVQAQPDGEVLVPLYLSYRFNVRDVHDKDMGLHSLEHLRINDQPPVGKIEKDILIIKHDLANINGTKYSISGVFEYQCICNFTYDPNNYTTAPDLTIQIPQTPGVTLNESLSTPAHYVFDVAEGALLPNDTKWTFLVNDQKVRMSAKNGYMSYGKQSGYLPPTDEALLAEHPTLQNRCLATFMFFDKKTKTTHYAVVEGRWPEKATTK